VSLSYYSTPLRAPEPYQKIELIAAGSALLGVAAAVACVAISVSRENARRAPLGVWVLWMLLAPASTATIAGLVGCLKTKSHTKRRSVAFIGFAVGLVLVFLFTFLFYYFCSGIYQYDG